MGLFYVKIIKSSQHEQWEVDKLHIKVNLSYQQFKIRVLNESLYCSLRILIVFSNELASSCCIIGNFREIWANRLTATPINFLSFPPFSNMLYDILSIQERMKENAV